MTHPPADTTEPREAVSPSPGAVDGTAWGTCQIRLLADRVASRRSGSTHKVYRDWRFVVDMDHDPSVPGTTLFTVPVDPAQLAASPTRYALIQLANQGVIAVGEASVFSWSTTSSGATDPFGEALAEAHRQLTQNGWSQEATFPSCFAKPDPTLLDGNAAPGPLVALATPPRSGSAGLDDWETEGGTSV